MQKLINIFVIVFILIGMVFFGAKAMSSDHHAPKEEQSQAKSKEAKKDKDKKEKTKPKKAKEEETETEETPVYDPNVSQEAQVPVEQTEVPEATVEDVQQPDTSYTSPVQQAPAYTNPQTYVPQQAPSQAEQSYNTVDNQNGQQTDALNNDQVYNAN